MEEKIKLTVVTDKDYTGTQEVYIAWYNCPNCEVGALGAGDNFCPNCGTKLIWDLKDSGV